VAPPGRPHSDPDDAKTRTRRQLGGIHTALYLELARGTVRDVQVTLVSSDDAIMLEYRVRGEFMEMPGLRLTPAQASRLWAVDRLTSARILDGLAATGFLSRTREGAYVRASRA
jgi:hypothetical protein